MVYVLPLFSEKRHQAVKLDASTVEIEERGVKLRLTVVDTPGYGDAIDNTDRLVIRKSFSKIMLILRYLTLSRLLMPLSVRVSIVIFHIPLHLVITKVSLSHEIFIYDYRLQD